VRSEGFARNGGAGEVLPLRNRLLVLVREAAARQDLLPSRPADRPPPRETKEALWLLWQEILGCTLALDEAVPPPSRLPWPFASGRDPEVLVSFTCAALAAYRCALDFLALSERDPVVGAVLNDSVPELGLPPRTYDAFKSRFLRPAADARFAALHAVLSEIRPSGRQDGRLEAAREDARALWAHGRGVGPALTLRNAASGLQKALRVRWFPVQKGASLALSRMRLPVRSGWNIRPRQARRLLSRLLPGDILLERREWAFTNLGLPGFWTHAALFVGAAGERRALSEAPGVRQRLGGVDLERALADRHPEAYALSALRTEDGRTARVIEALSQG
jgi:hypothetical protein